MSSEGHNIPSGFIKSPKRKLVPVPIIYYPNYQSIVIAKRQVRWLLELAEHWAETHPGFAQGNLVLAEEISSNIQKLAF